MIPTFKKYLKESVWGSIRKKSLGLETRIEETMDKFYEYLEDHYSFNDQELSLKRLIGEKGALFDDYIRIPISENFPKYICLFYAENKTYLLSNAVSFIPNLYKKIEENFKVTENNPNEFYTLIEPIDGESDSKFCLTLIEFMIDNIDERNEPLIFRKELSESVWGNIRKKSLGQETRIEEDINQLTCKSFLEYIKKNYCSKNIGTHNYDYCFSGNENFFSIPLGVLQTERSVYSLTYEKSNWKYDYKPSIRISYDFYKRIYLKHIYRQIKNKFKCEPNEVLKYIYIFPNDGSDVTNRFYLEVMDYFINNVTFEHPFTCVLKKKEELSESVWGNIRKKSLGQEERLEDNVDLMEGPEFFEYLKKNYKCNTEDTITYNKSDNIINIRLFESKPFIYKYLQYKINKNEIVTDLPTDKMSKDSSILLNMANEHKFDVVYVAGFHKIYPSNGEVTNGFFLEVLDYIIDQVAEVGPKEIDKL